MSPRQTRGQRRVARRQAHVAARRAAAAADPLADVYLAHDEWRAALHQLPDDERTAEARHMAGVLRRRADDLLTTRRTA